MKLPSEFVSKGWCHGAVLDYLGSSALQGLS